MRRCLVLVMLLCAVPCLVSAADDLRGNQASCRVTVEVPPAALIHLAQAMGQPLSTSELASVPAIPPTIVDCRITWSGSLSRTELYGPDKLLTKVLLADQATGVTYELDPWKHHAEKTQRDTSDALGLTQGDSGLSSLAQDYASVLARFRGMKGTAVTEIGSREVNGYACHGLGFVIDLTQYQGELTAALVSKGEAQGLGMVLPMLKALSPATGEVWVSDEHKIGVQFKLDVGGIKIDAALTDLHAWSGPASTFAVPAEYLVQDPAHPTLGVLEWLRPWHTGRPGGV